MKLLRKNFLQGAATLGKGSVEGSRKPVTSAMAAMKSESVGGAEVGRLEPVRSEKTSWDRGHRAMVRLGVLLTQLDVPPRRSHTIEQP